MSIYTKICLFIFSLIIIILYLLYHNENLVREEYKIYNNIIRSLEENDLVNLKYYSKKMININKKSAYYYFACTVLYNIYIIEYNITKSNYFKNKILRANTFLFNQIIKQVNYENIKK